MDLALGANPAIQLANINNIFRFALRTFCSGLHAIYIKMMATRQTNMRSVITNGKLSFWIWMVYMPFSV